MSSRWLKRAVFVGSVGAGIYALDKYNYASTLQRNLRTLYNAAIVGLDFKFNFPDDPKDVEGVAAVHARSAKRIFNVCHKNGGLYIKFGQQIASVPVLPPVYYQEFKTLFDDAPNYVDYEKVKQIFMEDMGIPPSEIFKSFLEVPVASASIAQVHSATLHDGRKVAVKIQKPEIAVQIGWDLFCFQTIAAGFEYFFEIPLLWSAAYIEKHIRMETDFINEASNSRRCAENLKSSPYLRDNVYVPYVYSDLTTRRIMTAEWIDGVRMSNRDELERQKYSFVDIMQLMANTFAHQIFHSGFVHADPHPGNFIVRLNPRNERKMELVVLDHGLYVDCRPEFTREYALFWKSMFIGDLRQMEAVTKGWGIRDVGIFASATIQRPWLSGKKFGTKVTADDLVEYRKGDAKDRLKDFLKNSEKLPKELVFIGRNMNCIRANNRALGSPVNRINIMALSAVQSLDADWSVWVRDEHRRPSTIHQQLAFVAESRWNYWLYHASLTLSNVAFWLSSAYQRVLYILTRRHDAGGMEVVLDQAMKQMMGQYYGLNVNLEIFDA